jgi:hypothetical protein
LGLALAAVGSGSLLAQLLGLELDSPLPTVVPMLPLLLLLVPASALLLGPASALLLGPQ